MRREIEQRLASLVILWQLGRMLRYQHIQEFHKDVRGSVLVPSAKIGIGLHRIGDPLQPVHAQRLSGLGEFVNGRRVVLVSHRSAPKIVSRQAELVEALQTRFGRDRLLHVPVWGQTAAAEELYRKALSIAEEQGAKLWELRAAVSLARLRRDQSRLTEARDLLATVYGWFTEGFDTPDLKEAKALLDALNA
jgi:hypothetical protein